MVSFSWVDGVSSDPIRRSWQRQCKLERRICLTTITVLIFFQVIGVFVYHHATTTTTTSSLIILPPKHSSPAYTKDSVSLDPRKDIHTTTTIAITSSRSSNSNGSNSNSNHHNRTIMGHSLPLPRVFIGIVTAANNHVAKEYRNRHRQLFQLWNDSRICTLYELEHNLKSFQQEASTNCQIIYTFVMGVDHKNPRLAKMHNYTPMEVTPLLLKDTIRRPLLVNKSTFPIMPRYNDILQPDVTVLNIQENMNQGKTPTFIYFASQVAQRYHIPYIMKCDSDAFLRLTVVLRFLDSQLPLSIPTSSSRTRPSTTENVVPLPKTPPVMIGSFVHKAPWRQKADESYWREQYHNGLHLYLAGQCYMISTNLALDLVHEARRIEQMPYHNISYWEGHEDHDASAMIEVGRHYRYRDPMQRCFWD